MKILLDIESCDDCPYSSRRDSNGESYYDADIRRCTYTGNEISNPTTHIDESCPFMSDSIRNEWKELMKDILKGKEEF
jgi:hypothetical protein